MGGLECIVRFEPAMDGRKKDSTSGLFGMVDAAYVKSLSFPMTFLQAGREVPAQR
jgi:hypothetical protein